MPLKINPFDLPEDQKGWRGLEITGKPRRRVFTVLENEYVLVTALLQLPGEPGVRHSHETGELSFHWAGGMSPFITWNRPGEFHGGAAEVKAKTSEEVAEGIHLLQSQLQNGSTEISSLIGIANSLQQQIDELRSQLQNIHGPKGGPGMIIDLLFPPFKTTINDPSYPEIRTFSGQWYD
ncbi:MAG: hypothetical protein FI734_03200 [SAR202 cluster bacterium]|nr:hypothetical protein [SAR202 cluster bacterium]|tara:strand:+ start:28256 stop:28792 length:537 start_codon:yes stop_codon:yes gene_type:complete